MTQSNGILSLWLLTLIIYYKLAGRLFFNEEAPLVICLLLGAMTLLIPMTVTPLAKPFLTGAPPKISIQRAITIAMILQVSLGILTIIAFGSRFAREMSDMHSMFDAIWPFLYLLIPLIAIYIFNEWYKKLMSKKPNA